MAPEGGSRQTTGALRLSEAGRPGRVLIACLRVVTWALLLFIALGFRHFWLIGHHAIPSSLLLLQIAVYVCCVFLAARTRMTRFAPVLLSLVLYWAYGTHTINSRLGDPWLSQAPGPIFASEILGSLLMRVLYVKELGFDFAMPLIGLLAASCYFLALRRAWPDMNPRQEVLAQLLYLTSPVHLFFFARYLETSQWSVPFLFLAAGEAIRCLRSADHARKPLIASAIGLAFAWLFHGYVSFVVPALPLAIFLGTRRTAKERLEDVGWFLLTFGSTVVAVACAVHYGGFPIGAGNVSGGGDRSMFVPLFHTSTRYEHFTLFSAEHLAMVANIVFVSLGALFFLRTAALDEREASPVSTFLILQFFGFLSFALLWNFDLGFPTDVDLMLGLSAPSLLLGVFWVGETLRRSSVRRILPALFVAAVSSWMFVASFVEPLQPYFEEVASHPMRRELAGVRDRIRLTALGVRKRRGTTWDCKTCKTFKGSLLILPGKPVDVSGEIDISLDHNDDYVLSFLRGGDVLYALHFFPQTGFDGLNTMRIPIEGPLTQVDSLLLEASRGDGRYSIGHLLLDQGNGLPVPQR